MQRLHVEYPRKDRINREISNSVRVRKRLKFVRMSSLILVILIWDPIVHPYQETIKIKIIPHNQIMIFTEL